MRWMTTIPLFRLTIAVCCCCCRCCCFFFVFFWSFSILLSLGALQRGYFRGELQVMEMSRCPFASAQRTKQLKGAASLLIDKLQPGLLAGVVNLPLWVPELSCRTCCPFTKSKKSSLGIRRHKDVLHHAKLGGILGEISFVWKSKSKSWAEFTHNSSQSSLEPKYDFRVLRLRGGSKKLPRTNRSGRIEDAFQAALKLRGGGVGDLAKKLLSAQE